MKIYYKSWVGANAKDNEGRIHPTQKPKELMKYILEDFSIDTDLIFDPFMGSWTTARACKDLGRNFIGCELDEKYCRIGEDRLRQEVLLSIINKT